MKIAFKIYQEDGWWMAFSPSLDAITQGKTEAEVLYMAQDLVASHLVAGDQIAEDNTVPAGHVLVELSAKALLAAQICSERRKAGLTMQQASSILGGSPGTYQRWEKAKSCNAGIDTIEKIAKAFGRRVTVSFS